MKDERLYPVGSVVLLKKGTHRVMIIGFTPILAEVKGKVYDYVGTFYPEGQVNFEQQLVFDHTDIDKVYAFGYSDDVEKDFRKKAISMLDKIKDEKGNMKMTAQELLQFLTNGGKK